MSEIRALKETAPDTDANESESLPHSIEAEQAIIGSLLFNNEVYDHIASIVKADHFFDPVHKRIFDTIRAQIERNSFASPITTNTFLADDEGFQELGGSSYLTHLAASVSSLIAAKDYAQMVYDMSLRRGLMEIGNDIAASAQKITTEITPSDHIAEAEKKLYTLSEQGQVDKGFQGFVVSTTDAIKQISAAYKRDGSLAGISTGLKDLDEMLGGLQKSDLLILAGRPSMGKTALATNIAYNVARKYEKGMTEDGIEGTVKGGIVGFFSLEMSSEQLASRILSEATRTESFRLRSGNISDEQFYEIIDAAKTLETCPLYIDDTAALPINQLATRARRLKRTHGLDVLIVDYLQLVRPARANDSRVNEVSEITQGLKAIAKELNIPVIALSQLSRAVEQRDDKKPQLADLRESGSIEQDADIVMFVYRAEYYHERLKPDENDQEKMEKWQEEMDKIYKKAEVIIGKQRHGPIGSVKLKFTGEYTKFENLADEEQDPDKKPYKSKSAPASSDDATDF